ncbi:MAG TPA: arabinofuranosidase catalytic domain-containing protein [Polyangiaceae bacterium]|nr:arabinofuranosidase catalytic domain-containing protein [Polyangiaceae bacterium]
MPDASSSASSSGSSGSEAGPTTSGPCDYYEAGGTPCVAAFSTVRALYAAYAGNLYQVRRADNTTMNIPVLAPGSVADSSVQDTFCSGTTCTISIIYDQSGKGNNLTKAPAGGNGPNPDVEAVATALPITISGHKAYGVRVTPETSTASQVGYRNDKTTGVATGDEPESLYEVTDGTFFNGACCFDFGNAETNNQAGPGGSMDAIYFGNARSWDTGAGNGPWVMADMEAGVYSMGGSSFGENPQDLSLPFAFVTAMLKNNSATAVASDGPFTLKGGNAQTGSLTTMYSGSRPTDIQFFGTQNYTVLQKQGAILLGIGGDNSSGAQGDFYEGVMTAGYASSATDDAVQANIVAAGYGQ